MIFGEKFGKIIKMTLDEIKNLIENGGGKFIIVEQGKPVLAIMSFGDYKKIIEKLNQVPTGKMASLSESEFDNPGKVQEAEEELEKDLNLEDLPL